MLLSHVLGAGMCQPVLLVDSLILSTPRALSVHHSTPVPLMAARETCWCPTSPSRAPGIAKASLAAVPNGQ